MKDKNTLRLSKTVNDLAPSGIRVFFDLVLGMKDVISLGVGEPDFVTPWFIRESAIYSLEQGYTTYTSNKGLYKLRTQISRQIKNRYSVEYSPDEEILITVGVSEALDLVMRAIINPGDEVLMPDPCYVSYGPSVEMAYGVPKFITTSFESGFKITPQQIKEGCTKKTKAILLNYPANPTGASYTKQELTKIIEVCLDKGLLIVSDEIYQELTYDYEHTPVFLIKGARDNLIYLNGFSKAYAMTGFRVGYACGPKEIIAAMTKIHQYTIMCVSITSQMAACEALQGGQKDVLEMKKEYQRRRAFCYEAFNRLGLKCLKPEGTFYLFASIKSIGLSSIEFAKLLLKKEKVAVVPGNAFGKVGEGFIRISFASSMDDLKEAVLRIERFLAGLKKNK